MQTRSARKRKLELDQEQTEPSKERKIDVNDSVDMDEKFEYFLELPGDVQREIFQKCTVPVKIHFNEVCRTFRHTGGWLQDLNLYGYSELSPAILTRFSALKKLTSFYNFGEDQEDFLKYAPYLTSLEELDNRISVEEFIPIIPYLTNLRKLILPDYSWEDKDSFEQLMQLTSLQSLSVNCAYHCVELSSSFANLTLLKCSVGEGSPRFGQLTNLKSLEYNGCGMDEQIYLLTRLERLKIFAENFTEEVNQLSRFENLTQLELGLGQEEQPIKLTGPLPQVKRLQVRYMSAVPEFIKNFPNLTSLKIRKAFALPPNLDQLKVLSIGSVSLSKKNIEMLSTLPSLVSLKLHGGFAKSLVEVCNLPTCLQNLDLDEWDVHPSILPCLTKLGNLTRLEMTQSISQPLLGSFPPTQEHLQQFLKTMPQLRNICLRGLDRQDLEFQYRPSWRNFLRQNNIYVDIVTSEE